MKSLKNIWVGNCYGDYQSLIVESEHMADKNVNYEEFSTDLQQLERIANNIALYLKYFKLNNAGENVAEINKAELLQQVEHRKGYDFARWADYKKRSDRPDKQERRLQLDPGLVVTTQKQKVDETIYWEAGLKLYTQAGHIKSYATGDTEEEARAALNIKIENFISAICIPSKNEPEPPSTTSVPVVPPAPVSPAPVSAQKER